MKKILPSFMRLFPGEMILEISTSLDVAELRSDEASPNAADSW